MSGVARNKKVRLGRDAETSTRDACATQRLPSPPSKGIAAMGAAAADGAFAASGCFRFKQDGVNVRKVFELQPRNFLANEPFDCLQRRELLAVHKCKGVPDI